MDVQQHPPAIGHAEPLPGDGLRRLVGDGKALRIDVVVEQHDPLGPQAVLLLIGVLKPRRGGDDFGAAKDPAADRVVQRFLPVDRREGLAAVPVDGLAGRALDRRGEQPRAPYEPPPHPMPRPPADQLSQFEPAGQLALRPQHVDSAHAGERRYVAAIPNRHLEVHVARQLLQQARDVGEMGCRACIVTGDDVAETRSVGRGTTHLHA